MQLNFTQVFRRGPETTIHVGGRSPVYLLVVLRVSSSKRINYLRVNLLASLSMGVMRKFFAPGKEGQPGRSASRLMPLVARPHWTIWNCTFLCICLFGGSHRTPKCGCLLYSKYRRIIWMGTTGHHPVSQCRLASSVNIFAYSENLCPDALISGIYNIATDVCRRV